VQQAKFAGAPPNLAASGKMSQSISPKPMMVAGRTSFRFICTTLEGVVLKGTGSFQGRQVVALSVAFSATGYIATGYIATGA
jgi:hypothetical protein